MRIEPIPGASVMPPEAGAVTRQTEKAEPRTAIEGQSGQAQSPATVGSAPRFLAGHAVTLAFTEDNKPVYQFVDKDSGDVVQQVPPEELLRVMRNIAEWLQRAARRLNERS